MKKESPANNFKIKQLLGTVHEASKVFAATTKADGKDCIIKQAKKNQEGQVLAARASQIKEIASDSLLKPAEVFEHRDVVYISVGSAI